MNDFCAHIVQRYEQEQSDGKHDEKCEFRPAGHYICHCKKRRREATGLTEPPGELIYNHPTCPNCYNEVESTGDAWACTECSVEWDYSDETDRGRFTDDYGELDTTPWDGEEHLTTLGISVEGENE